MDLARKEWEWFWGNVEPMPIQDVDDNVVPLNNLFTLLCPHYAYQRFKPLLLLLDLHMMLTGPQREKIIGQILPDLIPQPSIRPTIHYILKMTWRIFRTIGLGQAVLFPVPTG